MRVCLRSEAEQEKPGIRSWLRPGEEYLVLCIEIKLEGGIFYRIASLDGTPALFEADLFTITDPRVNEEWIVGRGTLGGLVLESELWSESGFWEAYFNMEPTAVARYRDVLRRMSGGEPERSGFAAGETVILYKARPEKNLRAGQKGTVVLVYEHNPRTYEVEFRGHNDEIVATETIREEDLVPDEPQRHRSSHGVA